jgi:prepilin-type N-terminal cleavage/methylation domain-containing protein
MERTSRNGFQRHGTMRTKRGFTLIEIMIVVLIIGILISTVMPTFVKAKRTTNTRTCVKNMQMIDSAKSQWVMENGFAGSAVPNWGDLTDYIRSPEVPTCPEGSDPYAMTSADTRTTCPNVGAFGDHVQQ